MDVDALHKLLRRASTLSARPRTPSDPVPALVKEGLVLYRGPFLPRDEVHSWVLACRERTRRAVRRLVALGAVAMDESGRRTEALELERRAAEADPGLFEGQEKASA